MIYLGQGQTVIVFKADKTMSGLNKLNFTGKYYIF